MKTKIMNLWQKWPLIAASFVFLIGASFNSPNKVKETPTKATAQSAVAGKVKESTEPAKTGVDAGKKLYSEKGCLTCHQLNTKLVGPPVKDIAAAYSGNKAGLTAFLKGKAKAIVDPSQASVMQPQIAITKSLPPEQLNAIVDYILSIK